MLDHSRVIDLREDFDKWCDYRGDGVKLCDDWIAMHDELERIKRAAHEPIGKLYDASTGYGIINEKDSDAIAFAFKTLRKIANGEV